MKEYDIDMSTKIKRRDLKCCGNCQFLYKETTCMNGNNYCSSWEYDGLTRKEREI
jgi:hypothetical protein